MLLEATVMIQYLALSLAQAVAVAAALALALLAALGIMEALAVVVVLICHPMEQAVLEIRQPQRRLKAIMEEMQTLLAAAVAALERQGQLQLVRQLMLVALAGMAQHLQLAEAA